MNRICLGVLCVLITLSCESDKRSPLAPPPPTTIVANNLTVPGPAPAVGPGETARVPAIARFSDGSERDVADEATWTSSLPQIATVERGVITGRALGRTTIRAQFGGLSSSLRIVVQPAGTFIVSGSVVEPGPFNVGMATVAVLGSPNQVTANSGGFYELFGVSGTVTLRVSKPDYLDETRTLTVTSDQRVDLEIRPMASPTRVAGTYRVTLTVPASCGLMPDDQRTRTYTAAIEQNAARLFIELRDANFVRDSSSRVVRNTFEGKVSGNRVLFTWGVGSSYYYYDSVGVEELLAGGQVLQIWGSTETQAGQTMSGNLVGGFGYREGNRTNHCSTSSAPVVFTRN